MEFLWFLLIGAISGWLAGQIWKGSGFGLIGNIIVGILGAIIGGWLSRQLGFGGPDSTLTHILVSVVGAWLLLFILSLFKRA